MNRYKCLKNQVFLSGEYKMVPIRLQDRFKIMDWRNEQLYHLRQKSPLTVQEQESYFSNVVSRLFDESHPGQILFSFLDNENCIGYGGLVHINWAEKNAEISFIMETRLEKTMFDEIWLNYIKLIEKVAFKELKFKEIYTYAFDMRPHLFKVLEISGFKLDKNKSRTQESEKGSVIIHSKKFVQNS